MSNSRSNVDVLRGLIAALGGTAVTDLDTVLNLAPRVTDLLDLYNSANTDVLNAGGLRLANSDVVDDQTLDWFRAKVVWTPVLNFGGATTGITYTAQSGTYTRIGSLVFVRASITLTSKGSATGVATITGLPFASAIPAVLGVHAGSNFATLSNTAYGLTSGAALSMLQGAATGSVGLTDVNFTNTSNFTISGVYEAA